MKIRLVLNGIKGEWLNASQVQIDTLRRTSSELTAQGYKNWFLEYKGGE